MRIQHERFVRSQKDLRYGDQSRQEFRLTVAIPGKLCSQDIGTVQHD